MSDGIAQLDWIIIFVYLFGLIAFSACLLYTSDAADE